MIRFLAASPRGPALSSRDAAPAALIILRYALRAGYSSSGGYAGKRPQGFKPGMYGTAALRDSNAAVADSPRKKRGLVSCRVDTLKRDPEY